ncbi:MAG: hypothetical protein SV186_01585 [Candidatus Nanohaloarchaea archaeon]|nr:hypothetical protein [Candidatus Nanohaloarchaea archaeon]
MVPTVETTRLLIAAVLVYIAVLASVLHPVTEAPEPGAYGSAHRHAYFDVKINNRSVDFSRPAFQLRADRVHFENRNGEILHVHAKGISVGYTLRTLGIEANRSCIELRETFCSNRTHDLRVYVDGRIVARPLWYVIQQGDNVMVWYGPEEAKPPRSFFQKQLPSRYRPGSNGENV